jgi:hypothetical protein
MNGRLLMLDRFSRSRLDRQTAAAEHNGQDAQPIQWETMLARLAKVATGHSLARTQGLHKLVSGRATLLAWQPTLDAFRASFTPGGLAYLCWGLPDRSGWRQAAMRLMLRRARAVLVNDVSTQAEIARLTGVSALVIPFFVDTQYFTPVARLERTDGLFCPGSNDRDPALLLALAERGHRITWLVNDAALATRFGHQHPNLECVSHISFAALKRHYQTCRAVISPIIADRHCAGQTTGMEAIACGAPLLLTKGRTSSIFADVPSVAVVGSNNADGWHAAILGLAAAPPMDDTLDASRAWLVSHCDPSRHLAWLAPVMGWDWAGEQTGG